MASYELEVRELEANRREIEMAFPAEIVDALVEERLADLRRKVRLRGFRPGRVPMNIVRQMFQKDVVLDIAEELAFRRLSEVEGEHNLEIIGNPVLVDHTYEPGERLWIRLQVEVVPDVELPDLSRVKVERPVVEVTDEDVDIRLERMRENEAIELEVEDGAKEGDIVLGRLKELDPSGLPLVGVKEEEVAIPLPASPSLDEDDRRLVEQLIGVKPGEIRQIRTSKPIIGGASEGVGLDREHTYSLAVESVRRREVPELDDEFARDVGDFQSVEELREAVRRMMQAEADVTTRALFHDNIRDEITKSVNFTPPQVTVERVLRFLMEEYRKDHPDSRIPDADLAKELRPEAIHLAKWTFLRRKLLEKLGIEITEDDVDVYIEDTIKSNPERAEEIRKRYASEEARRNLRHDLESERLYRALEERVQVVEVKGPYYQERKVDVPGGIGEEYEDD